MLKWSQGTIIYLQKVFKNTDFLLITFSHMHTLAHALTLTHIYSFTLFPGKFLCSPKLFLKHEAPTWISAVLKTMKVSFRSFKELHSINVRTNRVFFNSNSSHNFNSNCSILIGTIKKLYELSIIIEIS